MEVQEPGTSTLIFQFNLSRCSLIRNTLIINKKKNLKQNENKSTKSTTLRPNINKTTLNLIKSNCIFYKNNVTVSIQQTEPTTILYFTRARGEMHQT